MEIDDSKDRIRHQVWELMDARGAGRIGLVDGKIPNFQGAQHAAERLTTLERWQEARVIKANPDKAQAEVRRNALTEGRLLYMAVPRIATSEPFYELDPTSITVPYHLVVTGKGAAEYAPRIGVDRMRPVDVIVCGSVAVNRNGARIGKGAGYSDLEAAFLSEAGLIGPETLFVTTVHPLQIVDGELPETSHDFRVDTIVTPHETIDCPGRPRLRGVVWDDLSPEKIAEIPVLQQVCDARKHPQGR